MKILGSFIILAILNLVAVLAGPPPSVFVKDDTFEYYVMLGGVDEAYITDLVNKKTTELRIKPYLNYNGKQYKVTNLSIDLKDSSVEKIVIPESVDYFGIDYLHNAYKLNVLQVDAPHASFYENTFNEINPRVQIIGKGVDYMAMDYAKQILNEKDFSISEYHQENVSEKKCALYKIAKFVHKNFKYMPQAQNGDSGIHTLIYGMGNTIGLARVTRIIAAAAGYDKSNIRVGGDNIYHGWNFVEFERKWYILDYIYTSYSDMDRDQCHPQFKKSSELIPELLKFYGKSTKLDSNSFVIYHGMYGYEGEVGNPKQENFKDWLKKHNLGTLM